MNISPAQVQRGLPFGPLAPRRVLTVAASNIHPIVRIAHRVAYPINIPERKLFDHEFVLILAGAGELRLGGECCPYLPHDLLFIPPFVPHSFAADPACPGGDHIAVHFDLSVQRTGLNPLEERTPYDVRIAPGLSIPRRRFVPSGGPLEAALLALVREADAAADPLAGLRATREMLTVLSLTLSSLLDTPLPGDAGAADARHRVRVERLTAFVRSHLHQPLDAGRLADAAGLSVSRMNTVFRQATGHSPLEYVRRARIAEARRLLADPALRIKEIAARCGFDDSFHFSRVFRRVDGLSPTQYRDALLASVPLGENGRE